VPSCGYNDLADSAGSPEKAGVGGSIPSLATMFSSSYWPSENALLFHSVPRPKSRFMVRWLEALPMPAGQAADNRNRKMDGQGGEGRRGVSGHARKDGSSRLRGPPEARNWPFGAALDTRNDEARSGSKEACVCILAWGREAKKVIPTHEGQMEGTV
jgi:hypothetical protein